MTIRVRYAPSPTGFQHLGGARTALLNYLFARSHNGVFILRIEDTDTARCEERYVDDLYSSLEWLGIRADEQGNEGEYAPYIQSQKKERYREVANTLVETGTAYRCYTSSKESGVVYNRSSRNLSKKQRKRFEEKEARGEIRSVIRLKLPLTGEKVFHDMLLGTIHKKFADMIVDPILIKSDGLPTYHLANVVDDHDMKISHVLRSQEWIPSTPVHMYIYEVLGWKSPVFCHLSMILGEDGQKLSKRNGSLSIQELKKMGVLPEALLNYIALLGWGYDDKRELFSMQDLVEHFSNGTMHKNPAKFSMDKLLWFNTRYIKQLSDTELLHIVLPLLVKEYTIENREELARTISPLIPEIKERMEYVHDAVALLAPLFTRPHVQKSIELIDAAKYRESMEGLECAKHVLENKTYTTTTELETVIRKVAKRNCIKLGHILMPLRIALTGSKVSIPILPLVFALGKEKVFERIRALKEKLHIALEVDSGK
ncbi:glutamate--tRNA ligase-like [Ylistrum balloti]|uniref:glutamate--tRNA ligase-like n=1 Tax=Ylistrum balloti TaxID=509963 RepID=UPI002905BEBE|nr:glutamate--tRNA ligase-like [Ylistrum balloti]